MITANTNAKINAVSSLVVMHDDLLKLRSFVCFSTGDVVLIDSMIAGTDILINKIMKVKSDE